MTFTDYTGQIFGRLTALFFERRNGYRGWVCRCACGTETWARAGSLKSGNTKSCGCLQKENQATNRITHRMSYSKIYRVWASMLRRCDNSKVNSYPRYGGRGIRVCPEWLDFSAFLRDMGEPPPGTSLDRLDNDGPYSPDNCRWATLEEQGSNKRNNHKLTAFGKTLTLAEWSRETGLNYCTLKSRISDSGWPPERALSTPSQRKAA